MKASPDVKVIGDVPGHAVEITSESVYFELIFRGYFLYMIVNECHCTPETDAIWTGNKLRAYSTSKLLKNADEFGTDYNIYDDEPLKHFEILTEDHLINVLTYTKPNVELIPPPETANISGSTIWHMTK